MPLDTFLSFFSICALIAISPGPDNIFVLLQTALYGHRVGFVIVLGLMSGIVFHTLLVTLGVAALLKASATAFILLKFIGAAYLLYLAYLTFKARPISLPESTLKTKPVEASPVVAGSIGSNQVRIEPTQTPQACTSQSSLTQTMATTSAGEASSNSGATDISSRMSLWQYYRRGIFMNITNPKVSLFFLAFFPQFTYSTQIPVSQQMLSLSGIFVLATFVVFNSIVIFSAYFGRILRQSPQAQIILNWITIVVFCGLALRLLLG